MAPPPHFRMSLLGTLGADEIFSMNLSLRVGQGDDGTDGGVLQPNNAVWNDLAVDAGNFFADARMRIHQNAVLRRVKFATLDDEGNYSASPIEKSLGQEFGNIVVGGSNGVPGPNNGARPSNSTSLALTLHTTSDLGRIKGRIYLPIPVLSVQSDGRLSDVDANDVEAGFRAFINNVNDQPGLDVVDLRVVVASGGRHNANGSLRVAPGLHDVSSVSVGRVPDVQRRRRNRLSEGRTAIAL